MKAERYTQCILTVIAALLAAHLWLTASGNTAVKAFAADRIFKIKWDSNGTIQNEYGAPLNGQVVALACVNSGCYAVIR